MTQVKSKADYSDYLTSRQSENTARKISQPMKIAQLLGSSGRLQNDSIKISLPERIILYPKNAPSQKKNVTNMCMKLPHNKQNVRRNLKFIETSISVTKAKNCVKAGMNNQNNLKKENLCLSTRRSFLLPPNTIKELYIKNKSKQNRFESQFRTLTLNSENINSRISETSESYSPPVENKNVHSDSVAHMKKNKMSITQSISSRTFNINEQSGINILHSSYSNLAETGNGTVEKIPENLNSNKISNTNICGNQNNDYNITINGSHLSSASDTDAKIDVNLHNDNALNQNNVHCVEHHSLMTYVLPDAERVKKASLIKKVERERYLSTTTNIYEDLHPSLQTVKSESCLNLQRNTNENEPVSLSKTELTVLASKLKHLVCKLEENLSDLKLTLTAVTKLLPATNKEIKDNNETKITQVIEITENLNDNVKLIDNMDTKLSCVIDRKYNNALKETCKIIDINKSNFLETNEKEDPEMQLLDQMYITSGRNKENEEILNWPIVKFESETGRNSACLTAKVLKNSNDSFVNLENELDIVYRKPNMSITPLVYQTPAKNKYHDKKIEGRPMKEYMALKSRMSCLLTPNIKRFNLSESKSNIHCESDDVKISVSDKLFAELYNLYEDSQ